ncbi:uncharacterized protein [Anabrus simplex]|uniref:uncharacterized protein n=1 Tax=Anabrus simplex TaxID=316456 RepID=UPI0035A26939
MFTRNVLFLVLGALFILQMSVRGEKETDEVPDIQWEIVQKWMEKTIDDLNESSINITASINKVSEVEESVIKQIRNTIKSDIKKIVDGLQNQAYEANVDINSCLKEVSDGGDNLAFSLLKRAIQCITDETNKAKTILSSEEELVKEVNMTWQDAKKEWEDCESSPDVISCRGKLVADAEVKEGNYANQEGQLVSEAAIFIKKLQNNTDYCVFSEISSIPEKLTRTILTMAQCVKNMTDRIN